MRRSLVLDLGDFPAEAQLRCRNIEKNSNPWGVGNQNRANWAKDLDVPVAGKDGVGEYLYWVGCAGSFDDRNQKVSKAIVKLLQAAGVSFSILGKDEKCCGDPARRIGNEYLFQSLAQENIETMNALGVKKIITQCPHCLNTIKNEYPGFGGDVRGHPSHPTVCRPAEAGQAPAGDGTSAAEAGGAGGLPSDRAGGLPRLLLPGALPAGIRGASPGPQGRGRSRRCVEADRNKNKSVCCGAGGGRMWMEEEPEHRVNEMRVGQLLDKQPEIIGVNCPYCLTMMEDGIGAKGKSETVKALDLAEILVARLKSAGARAVTPAGGRPRPASRTPAPEAAPETAQTVAATDTEVSAPAATTDTSKTEVTEAEEEN